MENNEIKLLENLLKFSIQKYKSESISSVETHLVKVLKSLVDSNEVSLEIANFFLEENGIDEVITRDNDTSTYRSSWEDDNNYRQYDRDRRSHC